MTGFDGHWERCYWNWELLRRRLGGTRAKKALWIRCRINSNSKAAIFLTDRGKRYACCDRPLPCSELSYFRDSAQLSPAPSSPATPSLLQRWISKKYALQLYW